MNCYAFVYKRWVFLEIKGVELFQTLFSRYASRVKLITNDASKNADNKEISRLKSLIAKMKKGETVAEEELDGWGEG